jgi:hypothetical protein
MRKAPPARYRRFLRALESRPPGLVALYALAVIGSLAALALLVFAPSWSASTKVCCSDLLFAWAGVGVSALCRARSCDSGDCAHSTCDCLDVSTSYHAAVNVNQDGQLVGAAMLRGVRDCRCQLVALTGRSDFSACNRRSSVCTAAPRVKLTRDFDAAVQEGLRPQPAGPGAGSSDANSAAAVRKVDAPPCKSGPLADIAGAPPCKDASVKAAGSSSTRAKVQATTRCNKVTYCRPDVL